MRTRVASVAAIALLAVSLAAAAAQAPAAGRHARGALIVEYRSRGFDLTLKYGLRCGPAAGTLPRPAAACAAIERNPAMVLGEPPKPGGEGIRLCPAPQASVHVAGSYRGRPVSADFGEGGCSGPDPWARFLPSRDQLHSVILDRGIGPLQLGQKRAYVRALLGPASEHRGGADVYRTGTDLQVHLGVPVIVALVYDRAQRLAAVIDNGDPSVDKEDVYRFSFPPRSRLHAWPVVRCARRASRADHVLRGGRPTTIIWPSADHPTVIVTNEPAAGCRAAGATEQAPLPLAGLAH